jgi:biotin transport system substrate-specific component
LENFRAAENGRKKEKQRMKTRNLALAAIFTALTVVFAQIVIPLPFTPVPFSMAVFAVYLTGALLPMGWAAAAQAVYLLLGAAGLPVYGGFSGGVGVLAGPTGGYLLTYPLMALLVAAAARAARRKTWAVLAGGMLCALAVCYLGGSLWYCATAHVTWQKSAVLTILPFLPFDLVKIALCAPLAAALNRALARARLLPEQRR